MSATMAIDENDHGLQEEVDVETTASAQKKSGKKRVLLMAGAGIAVAALAFAMLVKPHPHRLSVPANDPLSGFSAQQADAPSPVQELPTSQPAGAQAFQQAPAQTAAAVSSLQNDMNASAAGASAAEVVTAAKSAALAGVDNLKGWMDNIEQNVSDIKDSVSALTKRMTSAESRISKLEREVNSLKKSGVSGVAAHEGASGEATPGAALAVSYISTLSASGATARKPSEAMKGFSTEFYDYKAGYGKNNAEYELFYVGDKPAVTATLSEDGKTLVVDARNSRIDVMPPKAGNLVTQVNTGIKPDFRRFVYHANAAMAPTVSIAPDRLLIQIAPKVSTMATGAGALPVQASASPIQSISGQQPGGIEPVNGAPSSITTTALPQVKVLAQPTVVPAHDFSGAVISDLPVSKDYSLVAMSDQSAVVNSPDNQLVSVVVGSLLPNAGRVLGFDLSSQTVTTEKFLVVRSKPKS